MISVPVNTCTQRNEWYTSHNRDFKDVICIDIIIYHSKCVFFLSWYRCLHTLMFSVVSRTIATNSTSRTLWNRWCFSKRVAMSTGIRPTQSIIYVPLQVIRLHNNILLIVQYKNLKSCSEDFILKNLILRTRSCGTAFITQHSWLLHFRQAEICLVEIICTTVVPASKGHLEGASP